MSFALFLVLNFGTVIFLLWLFLWRRKDRPTQLNLRAGGAQGPKRSERVVQDIPSERLQRGSAGSAAPALVPQEKMLNVIFMYNGEPWDADEVLGIPAGSSIEVAKRAFDVVLKNSDPKTRVFFEAAFNAIQVARKSGP